MTASGTMNWSAVREAYPALERGTYLDTSSCGLVARSTAEQARKEQERLMLEGSVRHMQWREQEMPAIRRAVAASIGGVEDHVQLTQGFSVGVAQLAPLLLHRPKVLLVQGDYPTLHTAFALQSFHTVVVPTAADGTIPMERLARAIEQERPHIVAIGQVQWATGYMLDLKALTDLCRAHGAWSLVDATQSWCSVPIDLRDAPVDILGASGYKWPLAGFGNGFFHLAESARAELVELSGIDPMAALGGGHFDPVAGSRLGDALDRITQLGPTAIRDRVQELCEHAVRELDAIGVALLHGRDQRSRAGILLIEGGQKRLALLTQRGIQVALRGKGIRVGIHFYNTVADIDRLVEALKH